MNIPLLRRSTPLRGVFAVQVEGLEAQPVNGVLHLYLAGETFEAVRADNHLPLEVPPGEHVITQELRVPDPQWWWPWDLCAPGPIEPSLVDLGGNICGCQEEAACAMVSSELAPPDVM